MLTFKTQCNLSNAEKYFAEHLQLGDYYSQENQVLGQWFGTGAERLGLAGVVKETDFLKLCRNEHPAEDGTLTQRLNTTRWDEDQMAVAANRRVFYDFTFSPPKSVSIQAFIAEDRRILDAHMPKKQGLLPAVRNYIQKLIQSRRVETPKQNERNAVWKQNLNQTVRHQKAHGQRI